MPAGESRLLHSLDVLLGRWNRSRNCLNVQSWKNFYWKRKFSGRFLDYQDSQPTPKIKGTESRKVSRLGKLLSFNFPVELRSGLRLPHATHRTLPFAAIISAHFLNGHCLYRYYGKLIESISTTLFGAFLGRMGKPRVIKNWIKLDEIEYKLISSNPSPPGDESISLLLFAFPTPESLHDAASKGKKL